jgi:hypothetical protein
MREIVAQRGHYVHIAFAERSHRARVIGKLFGGNLGLVAEHRDGNRLAKIGVEGCAVTMIVGGCVLGFFRVHTAAQHTGSAHTLKR